MDCAIALSVVGGVILSAAYPFFLARILIRGDAGISITSQVLYLVAFLLRDAGIWLKAPGDLHGTFSEGVWLKLYLIPASVLILITIRYRNSGIQTTSSKQRFISIVKKSSIYITLSFLLAYRINYGSFSWSDSRSSRVSSLNWLSVVAQYFSVEDLLGINTHDSGEVLWATSVFLSGIAGIPQYITYYRHVAHRIDRLLMSVMAMISLASLFNIPLWIVQFTEVHSFNYIALSAAVFQAFAFWMFFVLVVAKVNDCGSDPMEDLEAQLEEYDTSRWGGEALELSRPRNSSTTEGEETKLVAISGDDGI